MLAAGGLLFGCVASSAAESGASTTTQPQAPQPSSTVHATATAPAADAGPLAQEAGTTRAVCGSRCHSIDLVVGAAKSYDDWHETVQKMLDRGAVATDEQLQEVMDYLYATATTIDVNAAEPEDLELQLGLTEREAGAVVARRRTKRIADVGDLASAVGSDPARFAAKTRLLLFR